MRRTVDPRFSPMPRTRADWMELKAQRMDAQGEAMLNPVFIWPGKYVLALEKLEQVEQPAGLSDAALRRRKFAARLWVELTHPPYGRNMLGQGNDFLATYAIPTTLDDAPLARKALEEAPGLAEDPANLRTDMGAGGQMVLIHGPTWSVVFPLLPLAGMWLCVCVDALEENFWLIEQTATARTLLDDVIRGVFVGSSKQPPKDHEAAYEEFSARLRRRLAELGVEA